MRDFAALLISIMRSVHKKIVIVAGFSENFDIFVIIKLFGFFHLQIFCIKLLMAGPFAKNVTQKWRRLHKLLLLTKVFLNFLLEVKYLWGWLVCLKGLAWRAWCIFGFGGFFVWIFIFPLNSLILDLEEFHDGWRLLPGLTVIGFVLMLGEGIELFLKGVNSVERRLILGMVADDKGWLWGLGLFHWVRVIN